MKKETESKIKLFMPVVVISLALIILTSNYYHKMQIKAKATVIGKYTEVAHQAAQQYAISFDTMRNISKIMASYSSHFESNKEGKGAAVSLLKMAAEQLSIDRAYYVNKEGNVTDSEGKSYDDIKEVLPFVNLSEDNIDKIKTSKVGEKLIHYIVQPAKASESGYIVLVFSNESIVPITEVVEGSSYSSSIAYLLISNEGMILDSAGYKTERLKDGEGLIESFDKNEVEFINTDEQKIRDNMVLNNEGGFEVKIRGLRNYVTYVPIEDNDCLFLILISEKHMDALMQNELKDTRAYVKLLTFFMLVFISVLITVYLTGLIRMKKSSKTLESKAETDLLTGIYNKITTETRIREYLSEENNSGIMFLLDIDNFKKINDTMGHAFGDEVIRSVGQGLKAQFRATDIVGRLGGDEFLVLLKDISEPEIMLRESSKLELLFKDFQVGTYTKYSPTASIGAVVFPRDGDDFETLYKRADEALYKSKNNGRNQLTYYRKPGNDE
ncbi:MAG: GGDEF domain-containing protein [Lachnospiraceae bacterium]|nr:GGDEF domain-containing protein [Lachnospiraceae bacterium]